MPLYIFWPIVLVCVLALFLPMLVGIVVIRENQVGVLVKRFGRNLPPGDLLALNGEAGYQADTLAPGWHLGYWRWMYIVEKQPMLIVPQGEIALVVASGGDAVPTNRILGRIVDCDNFQDARKFLTNGGEKGRQLAILTSGTYRINTALFGVISAENADQNGMTPRDLDVYTIKPDRVGIVSTLDGAPIDTNEIAGPYVEEHDNFQNAQAFLNKGGRRGLQEQILLSGSWNLNPWFARVEQVPMTEIPIGHVGIVIAHVGKEHQDVSGDSFKHGNMVEPGHKGVWVTPLYPGKHPINTRVMKIELVPTTNIVLNWATRTESHSYDANLSPITVRSRDGFAFNLDISQIIHIAATDAPRVISRVASVQNLVDHVLQPIVGNYFRNSAQSFTALDFLHARSERQVEAARHIRAALDMYDVQAIDTLIGDITPPAELMLTQTDRKIAEEQRKTYEVQRMAQVQRQELVRETALANIQQEMVESEQGVNIAQLAAQAAIEQARGAAEGHRLQASGEAAAVREIGSAQAESYRLGVEALGSQGYVGVQMMQIVGERNVRIIPKIAINNDGGGGMGEALLAMLLQEKAAGSE